MPKKAPVAYVYVKVAVIESQEECLQLRPISTEDFEGELNDMCSNLNDSLRGLGKVLRASSLRRSEIEDQLSSLIKEIEVDSEGRFLVLTQATPRKPLTRKKKAKSKV